MPTSSHPRWDRQGSCHGLPAGYETHAEDDDHDPNDRFRSIGKDPPRGAEESEAQAQTGAQPQLPNCSRENFTHDSSRIRAERRIQPVPHSLHETPGLPEKPPPLGLYPNTSARLSTPLRHWLTHPGRQEPLLLQPPQRDVNRRSRHRTPVRRSISSTTGTPYTSPSRRNIANNTICSNSPRPRCDIGSHLCFGKRQVCLQRRHNNVLPSLSHVTGTQPT